MPEPEVPLDDCPRCGTTLDVVPHLDCVYCPGCRWQARIDGAAVVGGTPDAT